ILGSEDLKYASDDFLDRVKAREKIDAAQKAYDEAKKNFPDREPIDEKTYVKYYAVINQYDDITRLRAQVKESFTFPQKKTLSEKLQNEAVNKYTEAKTRADSHWGITKWLAGLMPNVFKETAKDMADEKFWEDTLKGANFTDEDLHVSGEKENVANEEVDTNGEIIDVDVASRTYQDMWKEEIKVKDADKQVDDRSSVIDKDNLEA
ncbi:MAG: hypothetical protein MJ072_02245, partial [Clostridia bacterium]|nr:hypothetical protein [Clostridia bacterium]